MRTDSFTVVYRTGGSKRCTWHRTKTYPTREAANGAAAEIERMGYKALVHVTRQLDLLGMPVGWDWKDTGDTLPA